MLPGNHHFYITFKTNAPGVSIPDRLKQRFPDEMTIVLQNKFWDLKVTEQGFSVGLSFNQIPSTLVVPFSAITAFVDLITEHRESPKKDGPAIVIAEIVGPQRKKVAVKNIYGVGLDIDVGVPGEIGRAHV